MILFVATYLTGRKKMQRFESTKTISVPQLRVGDVAYFHGAVFGIVSTRESRGHIDGYHAYGAYDAFVGPSPVAVAVGKFISGETVPHYFGPSQDWTFQGNQHARVAIRAR
jgi:hypothetical protein